MTYAEKLKHPSWQKKRLEVLEHHRWRCTKCLNGLNTGTTLHVHHTKYFKGREPWEYSDEFLTVLCDECHKQEWFIEQRKRILISNLSLAGYEIPPYCPLCGYYNLNSYESHHYHCVRCSHTFSYTNPKEDEQAEREYQEYLKSQSDAQR